MMYLSIPSYTPPGFNAPIPVIARVSYLHATFNPTIPIVNFGVFIHPDTNSIGNQPLHSLSFVLGQVLNPVGPVAIYNTPALAAAVAAYQAANPGTTSLIAIVACLLDNVGGLQRHPSFVGCTFLNI